MKIYFSFLNFLNTRLYSCLLEGTVQVNQISALDQSLYCMSSNSVYLPVRKWQPTPVFLPGKSHGLRILVGYSPWSHKESDTTE